MNLNQLKTHFSSNSDYVHLNNSGQAPIPDVFRDQARLWLDRFYVEAAHCAMEGWELTEVTRQALAQFLGAQADETAFFQTTASAISQAAFGIPLEKGDEILTWDQEYPSNFYPWRMAAEQSGARVVQVPSDFHSTPAELLLKHITSKTKVVAVSWYQYQAGAVTDLKALSRALKGSRVWIVSDIIQGAGVRPFNFHEMGVDVACGGSHKFMCSGYGASYMLVKKERLFDLKPLEFGAMTFGTPETEKSFDRPTRTAAKKFEPGSKAMIEVIAMKATLDLLSAVGIDAISTEACRLAGLLRQGLRARGCTLHSPDQEHIVNFSPPSGKTADELSTRLIKARISCVRRGPGIRISPHAFNSEQDLQAVFDVMDSWKS